MPLTRVLFCIGILLLLYGEKLKLIVKHINEFMVNLKFPTRVVTKMGTVTVQSSVLGKNVRSK
jgi:hypothetical protein